MLLLMTQTFIECRCGLQRQNMMNLVHQLSTESASKLLLLFWEKRGLLKGKTSVESARSIATCSNPLNSLLFAFVIFCSCYYFKCWSDYEELFFKMVLLFSVIFLTGSFCVWSKWDYQITTFDIYSKFIYYPWLLDYKMNFETKNNWLIKYGMKMLYG